MQFLKRKKYITFTLILIILVTFIPKQIISTTPKTLSYHNIEEVQFHQKRLINNQYYEKVYPKIENPVFIDEKKMSRIRTQIKNHEEPTYSEWLKLFISASKKLDYTPSPPTNFFVPYVYLSPEEHAKNKEPIVKDANSAYELSLAYQVTGEDKYAASAIKILNAWSNTVKNVKNLEDTPLVVSSNFPTMIVAASLLESSSNWTRSDQARFKSFISKNILPVNTMDRENNWGNWGLLLVISSAVYLDDPRLYSASIDRWKYFIDHQINKNGHLAYEVTRNNSKGNYGIWYSHFSMQPQTLAAEIAKVNGIYLFDYISPHGKSLKKAFTILANWTDEPRIFPYYKGDINELWHVRKKLNESSINGDVSASISYFEILSMYYNNKTAKLILEKERPLNTSTAFPYITFTHGGASRE